MNKYSFKQTKYTLFHGKDNSNICKEYEYLLFLSLTKHTHTHTKPSSQFDDWGSQTETWSLAVT